MIGLAMGVVYYPLFLLPLWISFYWQRGVVRFLIGVLGALAITALSFSMALATSAWSWSIWAGVASGPGMEVVL